MKKFLGMAMLAVALGAVSSAAEVDWRLRNEQSRINQGIASGHLNGWQASRLDRQEGRVAGEVAADRAANGGRLTASEWRAVNRQENRLSRHIYEDKHFGWNR